MCKNKLAIYLIMGSGSPVVSVMMVIWSAESVYARDSMNNVV